MGWRSRMRPASASTAARSPTSQSSISPPISSARARSSILAARDEHAVPARSGERAGDRLADTRRCSRDDGDALHHGNVTQMVSRGRDQSPGSGSPQAAFLASLYASPFFRETVRCSSPEAVHRSSTTCPGRRSGRRIRRAMARSCGTRQSTAYENFSSSNPRSASFASRCVRLRGRRTEKWHQSPSGSGQACIVRARREGRAAGRDHGAACGEDASVARGRAGLDDHERVGCSLPCLANELVERGRCQLADQ